MFSYLKNKNLHLIMRIGFNFRIRICSYFITIDIARKNKYIFEQNAVVCELKKNLVFFFVASCEKVF